MSEQFLPTPGGPTAGPRAWTRTGNLGRIICCMALGLAAGLSGGSKDTMGAETATGQRGMHMQAGDVSDFFLWGDHIHQNNIRTVLFHQKDFELSPPMWRLNANEHLLLRFDDLDADLKDYSYTLIHCDAHWRPSALNQSEYLEGFFEEQISQYRFSFNTRVPYTHYTLEIPGRHMRPLLSGNYILKVFEGGDRNRVVFTRRFMVFDPQIQIEARVRHADLVRYRDTHQQVEFTIHTGRLHVPNPYNDIQVVITQNHRWDNAVTGLLPRRIQGNSLVYDYEEESLFEGGNEFRRFDTRSLRQLSERVEDISVSPRHTEVFLYADPIRAHRRYSSDEDINGRFVIRNYDGHNDHLESDYAWVHFSLPMNNPMEGGDIYVLGGLTQWETGEHNRMQYSSQERKYKLSMLLKQGYYNYLYAFVPQGQTKGQLGPIEGNHRETGNEYSLYVYYRRPGTRYDQLIGVTQLNTADTNPR